MYTFDMEQNKNKYENKMIKDKKKTNISNVITIENNKTYFSKHPIKQAKNMKIIICIRITYL